MSRLPTPGGDNGDWGGILNDYLSQAHNTDGSLKSNVVTATQIQNGTISEALLDTSVQTKLNASAGTPDWSTIANKPAVIAAGVDQASARAAIGAGTASTKSDIGLANVDNTSDATKNAAAASLTNKDLTSGTNTFPTLNQNTTGNAATATKLATARTINGVSFDGTANITVADSTKVPTTTTVNGHPLSSNVTVTANDVLPTQTSNSGKYLTTDGTNSSWATVSGGGGTATPTASTVAEWDANVNMSANVLIPGFATQATAGGTTTLTVTNAQTQEFTGTAAQTVKLPTTGVAANDPRTILNHSTGLLTIQSSAANTIVTLAPGQCANFTALVATPTTAANWNYQIFSRNAISCVVQLDDFSGTDDQKLTAAMTWAAAQNPIPAIQFPNRTVSLSTGGRTPYSGMRLIGPTGSEGPKNPEITTAYAACLLYLNVGVGTSSLFNGAGGTYYDIYVGGLTIMNGNAGSQFWHQPSGTLYACQFHSLTFYAMNHVFGDATNKALFTQVIFTGHWQVISGTDTQFHLGGSDCSLWMSGYCNMANTGTASGTQYLMMLDTLAKTNIGYLYVTTQGGFSGLLLEGSGSGVSFHGGTFEGLNAGLPSTGAPVTITGGDWSFFGSSFNYTNTANGVIIQSGGTVALYSPSNNPATSTPSPLLYQTAGTAYCVAPQGAAGGTPQARWSDGTTTPAGKTRKRVVATSAPGATPSINSDVTDVAEFTAMAAAVTSLTTNLTGSPSDGDELTLRFTDNGTGRAITHGSKFLPSGTQALLTTTVANKVHVEKFNYDASKSAYILWYVDATGY
jgi:hypothetical protein